MKFDPKKLTSIREAAGYRTVREASLEMFKRADVNVSDRAWAKWEKGENEPGSKNLAALATLFAVPIDAFFSSECGHDDTTVPHRDAVA